MSLSYSPGLGLLCLLALLALSGGLGLLVTRRLPGWHSALERYVFAVPVGMGLLGLLLLPLGLLRLFQPGLLKGLLFGGALVGAALIAAFGRGMRRTPSPGGSGRDLLGLVAGLVFGVLGLCTLVGALAPPGGMEWDTLSYHLTVPKTYLREGRILFLPYDHHSNFPFLVQMLYTLMLGAGSVAGAKLVHWLCGVLLVASVYTFAARHYGAEGRRLGTLAALFVAATPIALWEAATAYVDLATALYTWLSLYALFNAAQGAASSARTEHPGSVVGAPLAAPSSANPSAIRPTGSVTWLVLSAVLMGFALGTKMTVLGFWGMLLVGILGWHLATTGRWAKESVPHAALWGAVSLAVGAPWYVKTWLYTGNPVYPFFFNRFGGRYWDAPNAAQYAADQATLGLGKGPVDLLLAPWNATVFPTAAEFNEYGFTFVPALLALALAAPLVARRYSRTAVYLALFAGGGYVFWFFLMQQARYFLPVLPALALIAAHALLGLWAQGRGAARWLGAAIAAASVGWGVLFAAQQIAQPAVPAVTGRVAVPEYVRGTQLMGGLAPAVEYINRNAPPDAKVALFDEVLGFYIDRPILWATPNHAVGLIPWESYAGVDDWLADFQRRGYTYLLVNEANAPAPDSPLAGQRWRSLLPEAVAGDKVEEVVAEPSWKRGTFVRVYRIR